MDIRQLQNEEMALGLQAKYQPIIDTIMLLVEGIDVMSQDARLRWIHSHVLRVEYGHCFFVEDFINGTKDMGDSVLGLTNDSLGRTLLQTYSANDIIYACTYFEYYNSKEKKDGDYNSLSATFYTHGKPPIFKEERKMQTKEVGRNFRDTLIAEKAVIGGLSYQDIQATNCRVQIIKKLNADDENDMNLKPIMGKEDIEEIIRMKTPDFVLTLDTEEFSTLRTQFSRAISQKDGNGGIDEILERMPSMSGEQFSDYTFDTAHECSPIKFQIDEKTIPVPDLFSYYVKESGKKRQDYRFFKTSDGYIIDTSDFEFYKTQTQYKEEIIEIEVKVVTFLNVMIFDSFTSYPSVFINYDPLNPKAQPPSVEELQASEAKVLELPISILRHQMKVPYRGKKIPISALSLNKWSKSDLSYGEAVQIINEHVSYYTSVNTLDGKNVRVNNGTIYEQTKKRTTERLTDSKGLNRTLFMETMSKYVYTIEETFFNLNPTFTNPEKLLGYFLGMGIVANNLYLNQINPYRLLCARLLGIDYALNYFDLCKNSAIAGHLFIDSFDEGKPIFCNADVLLDSNFYATQAKIQTELFQNELTEFFGVDFSDKVLQNHEDLLKEFSPKFMKLHHGTKKEYEKTVRNLGVGSPYEDKSELDKETIKGNRMQEITRITLALGLVETNTADRDVSMLTLILKELNKSLDEKYRDEVRQMLRQKYDNALSYNTAVSGKGAFNQYSNKMDGSSLYARATDKLRYNELDKTEAIQRFYFEPKSARAGAHNLLTLGISITNKELKDDDSPRKTGIIKINWKAYDTTKKQTGEPPKLDAKFIEKGLKDFSLDTLKDLGYDIDDPKVIKDLARLISLRAIGIYHEKQSMARIEGDELYTLAYALAMEEDLDKGMEFLFNLKYNNFSIKPFDHIPIFLENNRAFGDTSRFIADSLKKDGSAAGFSLRKAQQDGLRFLGASGNSGLLAHEVGFGKTTSSIAKVSDMFLRGDAKRVLISVPKAVYDAGNWEQEIQGAKKYDEEIKREFQTVNGLLPPNITLIKLGSMNYTTLRGKKIAKGDPEFDEKSEGTGYDGAMAYSKNDMQLIENLKGTTQGLIKLVGGAMNKYGKNNETSMLTPREQKYQNQYEDNLWIEQNPFFKKSEKYKISDIVRINDTPQQSLVGLTKTIKSGDFDFWDIGENDYVEFGRISDISDASVDAKNSFLKKVYEELLSKSPEIQWDDEDGGDLKKIISKLESIHKKYQNQYEKLSNTRATLTKKGRGEASLLGGAHPVLVSSVKSTARANPSFDIDVDEIFREDPYSDYKKKMSVPASNWIAVKTMEILKGKKSETSAAWFPYYGIRSFWERVVLPWAKKNHKNSPYKNVKELADAIYAEFPFTQITISEGGDAVDPALESLAKAQIKTALELQMTEEIAYFFITLSKDAPLFLGKFKEWASRPNSVVLCSHLAIPKLSVSQQFGEESVDFMAGVYGKSSPIQYLNGRVPNPYKKGERKVQSFDNKSTQFAKGVRTRGQTEKLFLSQYRGLDINLLSCDALIVDEVHNFNRAFNNVKKGSRVTTTLESRGKIKDTPAQGGKIQANIKGSLRYPENVYAYDTKANYNIRGEVQNFISVCLYFQERARYISEGQKRKIENTIFLSATPFTDDNFQMLSLFGAMSANKLMQGNVFNTFDFFQLYAKEKWQKDIDYQNRYTLFPKIVGYKNIYSLSQLIKSFTNFKISDEEIEKNRPLKVVVGTEAPRIKGIEDDEALNKLYSQVPFNEVQVKMNKDLENYITLESDSELTYTNAEYEKAEEIFKKLNKSGKKESPADELVKELKKLVSYSKIKGGFKIGDYELDNLDDIEIFIDEIQELDPDNKFAKAVKRAVDDTDIEGAEGDDEAQSASEESSEEDDEGAIDANAVKNEDDNLSLPQKIAQRALEASRTQQLTLISPYYLTINNDKNLMNPYLPPLDGTDSENAKNVVENSPKLLYTCKAISKVLEYAYTEQGQRYAGAGETDAIMGQVVYANNYKFRYHGKDFFLFDLMTKYIIDENKELLEKIVKDSGREVTDIFSRIDGRTKSEKTQIVQDFNTGYCLILFGTETIKEGINLQKNCPLMYILQVGFVPVTYMQLHGRIWRQGNPYKYAFLINVLTQNSIDAFVYSKLEQKISSVKQMLGSEVYDSEATQFDVNVAEIKINLITDPEKLAEMQWEDDADEYSRTVDRLTQELKSIETLGVDYPKAREVYRDNFEKVNIFSENIYKYESYILGKFYSEKTNRQRFDIATQKLVDAQYPTQFKTDKIKDDFEANPEKYKKKDGKSQYESRRDMSTRLRKTVKITEMTLEEGIEEVIELNQSDSVDSSYKLSLVAAFNISEITSLTAFTGYVQEVFELSARVRRRTEKHERDKTRQDMLEDFFIPAEKVFEKIEEGASPQAVLESLGRHGDSKGMLDLFGRHILTIACLKYANSEFINNNRVDDFAVERIGARFRSGEEGIIIEDFNDLISSKKIEEKDGTSRLATLEDIDVIMGRMEKERDADQYKLDNTEKSKDILRKEFRDKIKQRDGETIPSVEDRVNDLSAIFPYFKRR